MDDTARPTTHSGLPPEPGSRPTAGKPDPAPERDEDPAIHDPRDRGGDGQPVGRDNISRAASAA